MTKTTKQTVAGVMLFCASFSALMGIITAEAFYPVAYSTHSNEISDLGATRPPESVWYQPSATIFNLSMILTGLLVIGAVGLLAKTSFDKPTLVATGLFGLGVLSVGIFPGNTGNPHVLAAMITFLVGGVAGIVSSRTIDSPLRFLFIVLGLVALLFWFLAGAFVPILGPGGTERWIAYPLLLWLASYGGYLANAKGKNH